MGKRSRREYRHRSRTSEPPAIKARIYVQDPKFARARKIGLSKVEVEGEPWLGKGPTSARFKVNDYDETEKKTYPAVNVLPDGTGFDVGRGNPETNFKFHQVNVWATMARLLGHLESPKVFGRRIPWAFPQGRLELRPHASVLENAYYDRKKAAIYFGYFESNGKRLYTCLSHDVIAHEFGHAVLDGLKPYYDTPESADLGGFHEFFGDAVAMTSALTIRDLIAALLRNRPRGKRDPLCALRWIIDMMEEWGTAYGERYLRSAKNRMTMSKLRGNLDAHDRSLVLSGSVYDIFRKIHSRQRDEESDVDAVVKAASYTSRMILRALDYCPPAGLDYPAYARAVLRADEVAYPVDVRGYRAIARQVLERRGIKPAPVRELDNSQLRPYDVEALAASETDAYIFLDKNREALGIPRKVDFRVVRVYKTRKAGAGGYFPPREIVVEFVWKEDVKVKGRGFGRINNSIRPLWCGGTIVFDINGNVLHYVLSEHTKKRERMLLRYLRYLVKEGYLEEAGLAKAARRMQATVGSDGRLRLDADPSLRCAARRGPKRK